MSTQQTIENLRSLRQVWQHKRWIKGHLAVDSRGMIVHPLNSVVDGYCLVGGLECVFAMPIGSPHIERYCLAYDALEKTLIERGESSLLPVWNDQQKSVEDIYELIDSTIARLEGSSHG